LWGIGWVLLAALGLLLGRGFVGRNSGTLGLDLKQSYQCLIERQGCKRYRLALLSGGIGVFDRQALSYRLNPSTTTRPTLFTTVITERKLREIEVKVSAAPVMIDAVVHTLNQREESLDGVRGDLFTVHGLAHILFALCD
jgi:hypothetical protein